MKSKSAIVLLATSLLIALSACGEKGKKEAETAPAPESKPAAMEIIKEAPVAAAPAPAPASAPEAEKKPFNIAEAPMGKDFSGEFPYFKLPDGYMYTKPGEESGTGVISDYDREYFVDNGKYIPVEGKTYRANIVVDKNKAPGKKFSSIELQSSFDQFFSELGAVKINNNTKLDTGEKSRVMGLRPFKIEWINSTYVGDQYVNTYVLKTPTKTLWVQYGFISPNYNSVRITILEAKTAGKISIIPASEMKKEIDSKGFIALYINFDTDKSTIKPDSMPIVDEIYKLMQISPELKTSIDGHTDNTGGVEHNQKLSEARAQSVVAELVKKGIPASRLQAKGMGQSAPIADNRPEEGKAKNRRVEIRKIN